MKNKRVFLLTSVMVLMFSTFIYAGSFADTANQAKESGKSVKPADQKNDVDSRKECDATKDSSKDHDHGKGNDDKDDRDFSGQAPVDPDQPGENKEVDEGGKQCPEKVTSQSCGDLVKLILVKFSVKIVGHCEGEKGDKDEVLWTKKDLLEVYKTYYSLPKFFFKHTCELKRGKSSGKNDGVKGCLATGTSSISICGEATRPGMLGEALVREMGRCFLLTREIQELKLEWSKLVGKDYDNKSKVKSPVTSSCQNCDEDFAESVRIFWCDGNGLKEKDKARYEFIRIFVMKGREFRRKSVGSGASNTTTDKPTTTPKPTEPPKPAEPPAKPQEPPKANPGSGNASGSSDQGNNPGGGDHGASGKTDQNPKNKDNNASNANNGKDSTPPAGGNTGSSGNSGSSGNTGNSGNNNSGGGDHGASGKTDQNPKNKDNNASTANNASNSSGQNSNSGNGKK
ncbi:MAG: hypothetical protein HQM09_03450 [Candidatus Riflebacteria bacterium]|nr:hypothetical protein [Candidatus Riflebacteria bacterium]